ERYRGQETQAAPELLPPGAPARRVVEPDVESRKAIDRKLAALPVDFQAVLLDRVEGEEGLGQDAVLQLQLKRGGGVLAATRLEGRGHRGDLPAEEEGDQVGVVGGQVEQDAPPAGARPLPFGQVVRGRREDTTDGNHVADATCVQAPRKRLIE